MNILFCDSIVIVLEMDRNRRHFPDTIRSTIRLFTLRRPTPSVPSRARCHTLPEGQESAESAVSGRGRNDTINCRFQDSGGVRSYRLIILAVLADNAAIVRPALDIHVEYQGHFQAQSWNRVAPSAPHFLYSFRTFPLVTKSFRKMPSGGFDPRIPPLLFAVCSVSHLISASSRDSCDTDQWGKQNNTVVRL